MRFPPRGAVAAALALSLAPSVARPAQGSGSRDEAIEALGRNDLDTAERVARRWLEDHPADTELTRLLGMVLVTRGMQLEAQERPRDDFMPLYSESLAVLQKAEQLGGDRPQPGLHHAIGYLLLSHRRLAEAEQRLGLAIAEAPRSFVLYRLRGTARGELGRYPEAEEDLRRAIELDPKDMASRLFLAHVLQLQGRNRDAADTLRDFYERIEGEPPDERHFRALYEIAGYTLLLNDVERAREPLEKACRLRPQDSVCRNELGKLYHRLEEFELAVPELEAVLADSQAPRDVRREALHYRALIAHHDEDYPGAIRLFEASLEISPNQSESLKALAAALKKNGERDQAREVLERLRLVVEIDNEVTRLRSRLRSSPLDREARLELAELLLRLDRRDEARVEIETLESSSPGDPALAELARQLGPAAKP